MQYGIISDIHANLEALNAVLSHAGDAAILCLGDLVDYGPQPNEVVDIIRSRAIPTVLGNHDLACADGTGTEYFSTRTKMASYWTQEQLRPENRAWLLDLPYVLRAPSYALVHGSPYEPERFQYIMHSLDARRAFEAFPDDLVTFVGHSHLPTIFKHTPNGGITHLSITGDRSIALGDKPGQRYIVNVGSTGQPRDDDPRASYVLYDDEARTVSWRRVAYDVAATQARIRAVALPPECGQRLASGT